MSIGNKLIREIEREAAAGKLPLTAGAEDGHTSAKVVLTDRDRLGSLAAELTVARQAPSPSAAKATVRERAEQLAARATYLPERLQFVETDAGGSAILRSTPETMRAPRSDYFEARVNSHEVSLRRFKPRAGGGGRDAVPFHATDDIIGRLAEDAAAVLSPKQRR